MTGYAMGSLSPEEQQLVKWELEELRCADELEEALRQFVTRQLRTNKTAVGEVAGTLAQILGDVINDENDSCIPMDSVMLPLIRDLVEDQAGLINGFLRFAEFEMNVECVEISSVDPEHFGLPPGVERHSAPLAEWIKGSSTHSPQNSG